MDPKTQFGRQKQILSEADVVCSTCSGADHPLIQHMTFARVLLDEAAQATELSSLVPLMKMKPEACVTLVGDHRQLPPTISNVQVDVEGFGTSLFERMAGQGVQPYLLNIQYRMHPCISAFPSSMCLGCGSQGHDAHDDSDGPSETFVPKQDAVCGCI